MKKRSEAKKARARVHTAQNKVKRIGKALRFAGGSAVELLQGRLNYWKSKL